MVAVGELEDEWSNELRVRVEQSGLMPAGAGPDLELWQPVCELSASEQLRLKVPNSGQIFNKADYRSSQQTPIAGGNPVLHWSGRKLA